MAKVKYSRFVSPVGVFDLCWVTKPSKKYKSEDEEFKTNFIIEDTKENRDWCEKVYAAGMAEGKSAGVKLKKSAKNPFTFPEDMEEDDFLPEEDKDRPKFDPDVYRGKIHFTTKTQFRPGLIDRDREPLEDGVSIFGGDLGRVKVEVNPYDGFGSGISLRLVTAQLVKKNSSFGGVDADGFDDLPDDEEAGDEEEF